MDTNVGETTTESTSHNIVQPIMPLEIPKSLRYGDYRWWMRNRTKWAMSDIEMFVCVRNAACERTLDIPLNKQNRKDERELLKSVVRSDPLWKYMLDIEARFKSINQKLYQVP